MIRRGRLQRRTPLKANQDVTIGWQRRSRRPLPAQSGKRKEDRAGNRAVRDRVIARDGGCVMRSVFLGPQCAGPLDFHHLHKAGQGGPYTEENGVCLCRAHNGWVEDAPTVARSVGLVIRPGLPGAVAWDYRVAYGLIVRTDRPGE